MLFRSFALAVVVSFLISLLHDKTVDLADGFFNRRLDRVEHELGEAVRRARSPAEIEHILADDVFHALKLTSAATFRLQGSTLSRDGNGKGWDNCEQALRSDHPILAPLTGSVPFKMKRSYSAGIDFPKGFAHPVLAVPAVNPARCFAVSLYGSHATGTDFDHNERAMLARLSSDAAAIYAELENRELREKIA